MKAWTKWKKWLAAGIALALLLDIGVGIAIHRTVFYPKSTAYIRPLLERELASFRFPASYKATKAEYKHGYCFDNCPTLTMALFPNTTREQLRQLVLTQLHSNGFHVNLDSAGDMFADKGKVHFAISLEPDLGTGTRGYESNIFQQLQIVDKAAISFSYS